MKFLIALDVAEALLYHNTLTTLSCLCWPPVALLYRYLHSLETPVVHGNLRPKNILISNGCHVMLTDFGMNLTKVIAFLLYELMSISNTPPIRLVWELQ
jgi:serine/threonine protein kinase